jgi:beta-N-acetylhexosaminidase
MKPLFLGLVGERLTDDERALFREADPAGYILFKRNVVDRTQLRALTDDLRALSGRADLPILIDQEGGRVARMQPPEWPAFPAGARFDAAYEIAPMTAIEAVRANARALALMLAEVGITVDCLPLLDVRQPGAHDIIGDRAFGSEPLRVAALGRATIEGLRDGGVVGVVKHMPGHGRALADSHVELPTVDAGLEELEIDLAPFVALKNAPMAMTAHVIYTAWDSENCATLSRRIINEVIRNGIGFDGLLMSDDLGMHALKGDFGVRASGALAAGCDIALHCSGDFAEMSDCVAAVDEISAQSRVRLDRAMATVATPAELPPLEELLATRDAFFRAVCLT